MLASISAFDLISRLTLPVALRTMIRSRCSRVFGQITHSPEISTRTACLRGLVRIYATARPLQSMRRYGGGPMVITIPSLSCVEDSNNFAMSCVLSSSRFLWISIEICILFSFVFWFYDSWNFEQISSSTRVIQCFAKCLKRLRVERSITEAVTVPDYFLPDFHREICIHAEISGIGT